MGWRSRGGDEGEIKSQKNSHTWKKWNFALLRDIIAAEKGVKGEENIVSVGVSLLCGFSLFRCGSVAIRVFLSYSTLDGF